jgi:hypothetical protein
MHWKETTPMDEILRFVSLANSGRFTVLELCEDFGISRKTRHKYLVHYETADPEKGVKPECLRSRISTSSHGVAKQSPAGDWRGFLLPGNGAGATYGLISEGDMVALQCGADLTVIVGHSSVIVDEGA